MVYEVPKSKKSVKQDKFEVKIDGKEYALPSMRYIKPALIAAADDMSQYGGYRHILETFAPGLFDQFEDADQIDDFMVAWQEFSKIDMGESSASSRS